MRPRSQVLSAAEVIQLESARMSVASHFAGKDPTVRATYERLIDIARALGPVTEEAKKTSIHLVRLDRDAECPWGGWQCRA